MSYETTRQRRANPQTAESKRNCMLQYLHIRLSVRRNNSERRRKPRTARPLADPPCHLAATCCAGHTSPLLCPLSAIPSPASYWPGTWLEIRSSSTSPSRSHAWRCAPYIRPLPPACRSNRSRPPKSDRPLLMIRFDSTSESWRLETEIKNI
jgi:hypothetical protein